MSPRVLLALAVLLPSVALAQPKQGNQEAARTVGFRLGGFTGVKYASSSSPSGIGGGVVWTFDMPGLLVDASFDAMFGASSAQLIWGGFGAYYPFLDGETTPYVGAGLKLGWAKFGGDGAFGLMPFGSVGLLIGRSWSPNVRIDLALFGSTGAERATADGSSTNPAGLVATFGIGF